MPGSILRPNGSTPGFSFILTGTKRAAATGGPNFIPPPPFSATRGVWSGLCSRAGPVRKMAQSASMNAYQRSSAEIWMHFQQEFAEVEVMMRDLRSAIGKTPAPTPDTRYSSYSSSRFTSLGEAETSTGRAPLQHGGIPPRSQIHDGANWKKSQEHRYFFQGTRVVVSRCNSHSRVISQHQNADRRMVVTTATKDNRVWCRHDGWKSAIIGSL